MRETASYSDKNGYIRSIGRAARILDFVAREASGCTAKEISLGLGVPLPTAYHLLGTLVTEGLLTKSGDRRYVLGPQVGFLAQAFRAQAAIPQHLIDRVHALADASAETAYLSTWRHGEAALLAIVEGSQAVRVAGLHLGYSGASHTRASGKVLLAFAAPGTLEAYLRSHAEFTGADGEHRAAELRAELELVRRRGYGLDEEQFAEGVGCIAAPVTGSAMAIGISAPIQRYRRDHARLLEQVRSVCDDATTPLAAAREAV